MTAPLPRRRPDETAAARSRAKLERRDSPQLSLVRVGQVLEGLLAPQPRQAPALPRGPQTRLDLARSAIARFDELDRELCALLATQAPATWRVTRRALFRLFRSARRELRAAERTLA